MVFNHYRINKLNNIILIMTQPEGRIFIDNVLLRRTLLMAERCKTGNYFKYTDILGKIFSKELKGLFSEKALLWIMAEFYGAEWDLEFIEEELIFDEFRRCPYEPCEKLCGKCNTCETFLTFFKYASYGGDCDFDIWYRKWFKAANRCAGLYEADETSRDRCEYVVSDNVFCQQCQQSKYSLVKLYNGVEYPHVVRLAGRNAKRLPPHQLVELQN